MAKRRARRRGSGGRPRKSGPRTKSGRLSRAYKRDPELRDLGTRQAQAKRLALVNGSDPALFSTPLDVAYARGFLDREQHAKAARFRVARCAVFGLPLKGYSPVALLVEPAIGGPTLDDAEVKRREDRYNAMLRRLSVDQQLALIDLALDRYPRWLRCVIQGVPVPPEDDEERQTLLAGLGQLTV